MTKIIRSNILKPSLSTSRPCWSSLGHVGPPWAVIMPSWCNRQELSWSMFAAVGPSWIHFVACWAILEAFCATPAHLGRLLVSPWERLRARCAKSPRLRTRMKGHLECLGTSWGASQSQMFRITALGHKNEEAPWTSGHVLGCPLD